MHFVRRGTGTPLLMLHGLGSSSKTWKPIIDALAAQRDVISIDLPGHGETPPLSGEVSIRTLADAVSQFVQNNALAGIDVVGSSMGARLALELARRGGVVGSAVALDPGGFWQGWERSYFDLTIGASIRLMRVLRPLLPILVGNPVTRSLLLVQFSAHPWRLESSLVLQELRDFLNSPSFDALLTDLAKGPPQEGAAHGMIEEPVTIVWGRQDRVTLPRQAPRAQSRFPDAKFVWVDDCGHLPHWDQPERTVELILQATA